MEIKFVINREFYRTILVNHILLINST